MHYASNEDVIGQIGRRLGEYANSHPDLHFLESPLLGTGAGGMDPVKAGLALKAGFEATCKTHSTLFIYGQIATTIAELRRHQLLEAGDATATPNAPASEKADGAQHITGYDLFISHASEDKNEFVRPLALALIAKGWRVWYDESALKVGDSLRRSIDAGLREAKHGIVVLSPNFFSKNWPQYELDSLTSKEMLTGDQAILPVWHNVTREEVGRFSLALADRVALTSTMGLEVIVAKLAQAIGSPRTVTHPFPEGPWIQSPCPRCGKPGNNIGYEITNPSDAYDVEWFECPHCGYKEDRRYTNV